MTGQTNVKWAGFHSNARKKKIITWEASGTNPTKLQRLVKFSEDLMNQLVMLIGLISSIMGVY